MKRAFRKYFIPHEENNYKPHFLHTKRTFFYGVSFLLMKVIVVGFALLLPTTVFVMPDVLANEEMNLVKLVNKYRTENGAPPLVEQVKLHGTAVDKADDMSIRQYFGHISPEGRTLADIMSTHDYAYDFAGENLALGFVDSSELLNAWVDSPTHRKNILDPDFSEYGIALLAGNFENEATVFAVNHFGHPRVLNERLKFERKTALPEKITTTTAYPAMWTGGASASGGYDHENSFVSVARSEMGDITVSARVFVGIVPRVARIEFGKYVIPLIYDMSDGVLSGELVVPKTDSLSVMTSPILIVRDGVGVEWSEVVPLRGQVLSSMTPMQKYVRARKVLGDLMPVLVFSREIYLGFMALFSIALVLNIFVEIKKQHPHIILQTSGLIAMLFVLWAI